MALTKVTGSVIKDSVSLSGNVSVGGTLTYQDVTNVDALGIGTFRTGIKVLAGQVDVGSNIKLGNAGVITATSFSGVMSGTTGSFSGQVNVGSNIKLGTAGVVTATTFSGSGASLTNLNASAIASGTVPTARLGSGTASSSTFLRGDSTFAAVTSTTINSNADNRVMTGSGTANTLNGEANLTFDGSTLGLTGSQTISGDLSIAQNLVHTGDTDTKLEFGTDTVKLFTAGVQKFRIYDDGVVSIGQSTKSSTVGAGNLDIQGNATSCILEMGNPFPGFSGGVVPEFRITATLSGHEVKFESIWGGDNALHPHIGFTGGRTHFYRATNSDEIARFDADKFFIGQTTGSSRLCVSDTNPVIAELHHSDGGTNDQARISLGALANNPPSNRGVNLIAENNGAGHDFVVACSPSHSGGPTEKVRISSGGDFMVGTTSSSSSTASSGISLNADGAIISRRNGVMQYYKSIATGGYYANIFLSANTTVGSIFFNSGGTQFNTSSDYRRKENVVSLTNGISKLKQLKPYRFNFKDNPSETVDGFLAHEAQEIVPHTVSGTKDQIATAEDVSKGNSQQIGDPLYQQMDLSKLVPLLTAALQESVTKIEILEAKVAALEGS